MKIRFCTLWSQWLVGFAWEDELIASACKNAWGVWIYVGPFSVKLYRPEKPWHSMCINGAADPNDCGCDFCWKHNRDLAEKENSQ